MSRRRRSRRSYVVEFALVAIAVVAFYLFVSQGGAVIVGRWFASLFRLQ